jgi:hypothetical protein
MSQSGSHMSSCASVLAIHEPPGLGSNMETAELQHYSAYSKRKHETGKTVICKFDNKCLEMLFVCLRWVSNTGTKRGVIIHTSEHQQ